MRMAGLLTVSAAVSRQISTTLYNAALYAELEIIQRQNHSMSVSYVKPSMDAAIAGTYKDLKVKNPYDTPDLYRGIHTGKDTDVHDLRKRDETVEPHSGI